MQSVQIFISSKKNEKIYRLISAVCVWLCVCVKLFQSCSTLCDHMDYSQSASSILGIFQARILEWFATPSSRGSSQSRDWTCISFISWIGNQVLSSPVLVPPGEGNGNPLQYSCLENPVDREAWWAAVYRFTQSRTQLKWLSMHACIGGENGRPLQYSCLENHRDRGAW